MRTRARALATIAATALIGGGCLTNNYRIPKAELTRLAATPPAARADSVRVVQELTGESPPPTDPVTADTQVVFAPRAVIVVGDHDHVHPHHGGGPHGGGGHGIKGGGSGDGKAAVVLAVALAAAFAVGLAATEGSRYDGWVRLHPMHPVHLWGPWGYGVVPLAQLDPATAAAADRAVIREQEGPWQRLRRAPLDRVGWTYSVLGGLGQIDGLDGRRLGPAFHVQLGYFPRHQVGVQFEWSPSWRDDTLGQTILDMRWGLELDVLPLDAGPLHGGVFGAASVGFRSEAGDTTSGAFTGAGALLQFELSTRLAATARFGVTRAYDQLARDATIGLSIY